MKVENDLVPGLSQLNQPLFEAGRHVSLRVSRRNEDFCFFQFRQIPLARIDSWQWKILHLMAKITMTYYV